MALVLEVESQPYDGFLSGSVSLSLDSLAHQFQFEAASAKTNFLPFKGGESCRILINDIVVTTGFIEVVEVSYSAGSHIINLQGRSKTGDVVDSSLDALEINPPVSLQNAIKRVLDQLGLNLEVTDQSGSNNFDVNEDKLGPAIGQNAFDFIVSLARKKQVLLTTDDLGDILITRSESISSNSSLKHLVNQTDNSNNIKEATVNYDHTNRFNKYLVKSQLNASSLVFGGGTTDLSAIVNQGGSTLTNFTTDPDVRAGRQLVLKADKATSTEEANLRALWEANIRRARSSAYSAVVTGFTNASGQIWALNTTVNVVDEFSDINATKLINSIEFTTGISGGEITRLGMVEPDAYQVALEEPPEIEDAGEELFSFG